MLGHLHQYPAYSRNNQHHNRFSAGQPPLRQHHHKSFPATSLCFHSPKSDMLLTLPKEPQTNTLVIQPESASARNAQAANTSFPGASSSASAAQNGFPVRTAPWEGTTPFTLRRPDMYAITLTPSAIRRGSISESSLRRKASYLRPGMRRADAS